MQVNSKTSIPLTWAAAIIIFVAQSIITYMASSYGVKSAIKDLKTETLVEINGLKHKDELIFLELNVVKQQVNILQSSVISYIGKAILPAETKVPERKEQ